MAPDELLLSVTIPFTRQHEFTREFKQSPRRDDDIAIVNAGRRVYWQWWSVGCWCALLHYLLAYAPAENEIKSACACVCLCVYRQCVSTADMRMMLDSH